MAYFFQDARTKRKTRKLTDPAGLPNCSNNNNSLAKVLKNLSHSIMAHAFPSFSFIPQRCTRDATFPTDRYEHHHLCSSPSNLSYLWCVQLIFCFYIFCLCFVFAEVLNHVECSCANDSDIMFLLMIKLFISWFKR